MSYLGTIYSDATTDGVAARQMMVGLDLVGSPPKVLKSKFSPSLVAELTQCVRRRRRPPPLR